MHVIHKTDDGLFLYGSSSLEVFRCKSDEEIDSYLKTMSLSTDNCEVWDERTITKEDFNHG